MYADHKVTIIYIEYLCIYRSPSLVKLLLYTMLAMH